MFRFQPFRSTALLALAILLVPIPAVAQDGETTTITGTDLRNGVDIGDRGRQDGRRLLRSRSAATQASDGTQRMEDAAEHEFVFESPAKRADNPTNGLVDLVAATPLVDPPLAQRLWLERAEVGERLTPIPSSRRRGDNAAAEEAFGLPAEALRGQ